MFFFFFQAEDGIRDLTVTGVQTCALPILMALIAASASCVDRDTRRRRSPTALVSQKKAGTVMTATMVSCQLRMIIAPMVETKMTTLARIVEAVLVTTGWTPPTSWATRDWSSRV